VFIIYGIEKAGAYIRRLEDYLGDPNLGWEKFAFERELVDSRASVKQIRLFSTRDRLWVLIWIACIVISVVFYTNALNMPSCASFPGPSN
jgi:hypothetical protein